MKTVQYAFAAAILLCLTFLSANVFAQQNNRSGANTNTNSGTSSNKTNTNTNNSGSDSKGKTVKPIKIKTPTGTTSTNTNKNGSKSTNTNNASTSGNKKNKSGSKTGVFFGGGVNTTTDGKNFMIDAQPYIGYRISPQIQFTAGPLYQYIGGSTPLSLFGARAAGRYDITSGVYATGMFEGMYYKQGESNRTVMRMPLGAGYSHNLFGVGANVSVMYDVLYNKATSPYSTPFIISGGINIGGGNSFNFGKNFNMDDIFKGSPTNKK